MHRSANDLRFSAFLIIIPYTCAVHVLQTFPFSSGF